MLSVENLSLSYEKKVLHQINFNCQQKQLTCILGRNGAGKSSLIRCIVGLEKRFSGKIFLDNQDIKSYTAKEIARRVAVVLNSKVDVPYLRVYETVALGRSPYLNWLGQAQAQDLEVVEQALQITETKQFSDRFLHTLSDGERQRVMIARAIAQESPLIVLDEPTAFLDVYYRRQSIALLCKIATEQNKCIVLSTHEVDLAMEYAHQLLLLHLQGEHLFLQNKAILDSQIYAFLGL